MFKLTPKLRIIGREVDSKPNDEFPTLKDEASGAYPSVKR